MSIKEQIRPFVYVPPPKPVYSVRDVEQAYKQAVSRYIAKLVNGSKAA